MVVAHSRLRPALGTISNHLNVFPCFLHSTYVAHGRRFLLLMIPRSSLSVIHLARGLALACPALCVFIIIIIFSLVLGCSLLRTRSKANGKEEKKEPATLQECRGNPGRDETRISIICFFFSFWYFLAAKGNRTALTGPTAEDEGSRRWSCL
jgi:hypothetical protein